VYDGAAGKGMAMSDLENRPADVEDPAAELVDVNAIR
jgi:hypothetical protein